MSQTRVRWTALLLVCSGGTVFVSCDTMMMVYQILSAVSTIAGALPTAA